eukprot:SAG22_NODE_7755_length_711_cov_0.872549_1_plen_64_part_10
MHVNFSSQRCSCSYNLLSKIVQLYKHVHCTGTKICQIVVLVGRGQRQNQGEPYDVTGIHMVPPW